VGANRPHRHHRRILHLVSQRGKTHVQNHNGTDSGNSPYRASHVGRLDLNQPPTNPFFWCIFMTLKFSSRNIRLSITSLIRTCENGVQTVGKVDWSAELIDALILSGMSFFATLGATTATGTPFEMALKAGFIAAGGMFFAVLAGKRGLKTPASGAT
jgi:hypothetical protein